MTDNKLEKVLSLAKRRGFIFPGSEIYGGLANSWDYGPLGVELKNNIKQEWWKWFVARREDVVGIDPAIIMNPKVWEASGHVKEFTDPLVECKKCHERFRIDEKISSKHIPEVLIQHIQNKHSEVGTSYEFVRPTFTDEKQFNLLFKTFLGPVDDESAIVYLRGELAQAMFVNFAAVQQVSRKRLPFGIAAQGKVFRNEITPGNFIFRTREFDLMEFEYFLQEKDWERWFEYWLGKMHDWLNHLGVDPEHVHDHDIEKEELAHYSKRTIDIEYDYPFGRKELYGLAYRTDFDLKNHMEKSGADLRYIDPDTNEKVIPHVVEPTFGLDRSVLVSLLEAYHEDEAPTSEEGKTETRVSMKFPYWMAPVKVAVFPLVKNKEDIVKKSREVFEMILAQFPAQYDESGAVGRRYRRQDEIGTPLCVTIDFDTLQDNSVTIRDRDTMKQERVKIAELIGYIANILNIL